MRRGVLNTLVNTSKRFVLFLVLIALAFYQRMISPLFFSLGVSCRFHPSCSEYCRVVFIKFGLFRGFMKSAQRLSKCHPWHPGGVDLP